MQIKSKRQTEGETYLITGEGKTEEFENFLHLSQKGHDLDSSP